MKKQSLKVFITGILAIATITMFIPETHRESIGISLVLGLFIIIAIVEN